MTDLRSKIVEIIERTSGDVFDAAAKHGYIKANVISELADRILPLVQEGEWRSMESAPKDGTVIDVRESDERKAIQVSWAPWGNQHQWCRVDNPNIFFNPKYIEWRAAPLSKD